MDESFTPGVSAPSICTQIGCQLASRLAITYITVMYIWGGNKSKLNS